VFGYLSVSLSLFMTFVCCHHDEKVIAAVIINLSKYPHNGCKIMPFSSPGGSAMQWDTCMLCCTWRRVVPLFACFFVFDARNLFGGKFSVWGS